MNSDNIKMIALILQLFGLVGVSTVFVEQKLDDFMTIRWEITGDEIEFNFICKAN